MKMGMNNKGFSLVELMVVVAIIGILASMGVPALEKQIAKSRQSEAKTNLASIYTAEKAFFAEYGTYYGSLLEIGVKPEGKLRYNAGFLALGTPTAAQLATFNYPKAAPDAAGLNYGVAAVCSAANGCQLLAGAVAPAATVANALGVTGGNAGATVVAGAVGNFTATAGGTVYKANIDRWQINEVKVVMNNAVGIP